MSERDQHNRWRCTVVGCNPVMKSLEAMEAHRAETGHRTAKWPIRSAAGKAKAQQRNKTGYYDKYNVGAKARGITALLRDGGRVTTTLSVGCANAGFGSPIFVAGEFEGYDDDAYCGECDWCDDHDIDGEYAFGEDDF